MSDGIAESGDGDGGEVTAPAAEPVRPSSPGGRIGGTPVSEVLDALHGALDRRLLEEQKHQNPHWMALITIFFLITAIVANLTWDAGSFRFYWMLILPVPTLVAYIHLLVEERRRRRPIAEILGLLMRIDEGQPISPEEVEPWLEESRRHREGRGG